MIPRDVQLELVREAARAPSVHNVQPARWRFDGTDGVRLYRSLERTLPVADPTGRDVRQSLGAAFEGLAIALSRRGLALGAPLFAARDDGTTPAGLELVCSARTNSGRELDPLAAWVELRRAFRGRFDTASVAELRSLGEHFERSDDVRLALGAAIAALARRYDRASFGFLSQSAYMREFHGWCRFLRSHPGWNRDGLNADCLGLGAAERLAASVLLHPRVFAGLRRLGLARALVSEAVQVRSSAAIVLFAPRRDLDAFDAGRRFYRLWLEFTSLGFHACPLSALADERSAAEIVEREHGVPEERRLLNAFRLGIVRGARVPTSARLPSDELLLVEAGG